MKTDAGSSRQNYLISSINRISETENIYYKRKESWEKLQADTTEQLAYAANVFIYSQNNVLFLLRYLVIVIVFLPYNFMNQVYLQFSLGLKVPIKP